MEINLQAKEWMMENFKETGWEYIDLQMDNIILEIG
jgi:hypothetical protein